MSLNKVMLIDYLGQDPEIRYTPSGLPVVNFSLATNDFHVDREGKRHQRTDWHHVMVAGKLALTCNKYLSKDQQAFVEGRLRTHEWSATERAADAQRSSPAICSFWEHLQLKERRLIPRMIQRCRPIARSDSDLDATTRDRLPGPWRLSENVGPISC
jgi:single stranded DNA-binding protein